MKKKIKKYLIPHKENDFHPHLLRNISLGILTAIVFLLLLVSVAQLGILKTGSLNFASVIPSVLVDLTNTDRAKEELPVLASNPLLIAAAQAKANDMAQKGYFAHNSPEGFTPWYWMKEVGYPFMYAGENLAVNFNDSIEVEKGWMNSPGHRENILNKKFTEIGIATAQGMYEGRNTVFVVQMFGKPYPNIAKSEDVVDTNKEDTSSNTEVATNNNQDNLFIDDSDLEVLGENFIAVSEPEAVYVKETEEIKKEDANYESQNNASFFDIIFTSPITSMNTVYALLVIIIGGVLLLSFVIPESRKRKKSNKILAFSLIFVILIIIYLTNILVLNKVIFV